MKISRRNPCSPFLVSKPMTTITSSWYRVYVTFPSQKAQIYNNSNYPVLITRINWVFPFTSKHNIYSLKQVNLIGPGLCHSTFLCFLCLLHREMQYNLPGTTTMCTVGRHITRVSGSGCICHARHCKLFESRKVQQETKISILDIRHLAQAMKWRGGDMPRLDL